MPSKRCTPREHLNCAHLCCWSIINISAALNFPACAPYQIYCRINSQGLFWFSRRARCHEVPFSLTFSAAVVHSHYNLYKAGYVRVMKNHPYRAQRLKPCTKRGRCPSPLPPRSPSGAAGNWGPQPAVADRRAPPGPGPPSPPSPAEGEDAAPALTVIGGDAAPQGPRVLAGPGGGARRGRAGARQPRGGRARRPPARRPPTFPPEEGHSAGEGARRPPGRGKAGGRESSAPGPMNEAAAPARRRRSLRLFLPRRRPRPPCCQQRPRARFRQRRPRGTAGCGRTQHGRPCLAPASQWGRAGPPCWVRAGSPRGSGGHL